MPLIILVDFRVCSLSLGFLIYKEAEDPSWVLPIIFSYAKMLSTAKVTILPVA